MWGYRKTVALDYLGLPRFAILKYMRTSAIMGKVGWSSYCIRHRETSSGTEMTSLTIGS